ncbi:MAG: ABC transporter ATP-binding protein, partial [Eubacterium sp.]
MITIKNLTKAYGKQRILTRTNFQFPDSGLVCILGASGCGKSTLLNMIAGFDGDYSGEITVHGVSISRMNTNERCAYRRDNIGFVFQNHMLISGYTGLENIMLASELNHASKGKNRERAAVLLELLNMGGKANKNVENLSGGEKQRIAIARALINAPSILLADEPTGALDLKNAKEIMTLLKRIAAKRLVLVITHDPKICAFADQVITIKDEKIVGKDAENLGDSRQKLKKKSEAKTAAFQRGLKNFKVYRVWYTGIALMIAIGMLAFMLALSSGNILEKSIVDFKEKNTAFNNGYVKTEDN